MDDEKNLKRFNRYFFNATSSSCEEFLYGGCNGNENRFLQKAGCSKTCANPQNPKKESLKTEEFVDFEDNFGGWEVYSWRKLFYDSSEAELHGVVRPKIDGAKINEV